nr:contractile injection system protein, VgrG/Pvc8 family [Pseudodesulfovibrio sp.]
MSASRRAKLRVAYDNADISVHIAPYVVSFTFIDNAHGKADSLSIVLEDRDGLWKGSWRPTKGATLQAWIDCLDWNGLGRNVTLFCGTFEVDTMSLSVSEAGDTFTIKAVSAKVQNSLRREKKSRSWENTTLRHVLRDIAGLAGMDTIFDAADIVLDRVDQCGESDLVFLKRLSDKHGLNFKVAESSLVLFEGVKYDAKPSVMALRRGDSAISSIRLKDSVHDVYRDCTVSYHDPATKENREYTFIPPDAPSTGQTLKINTRVKNLAEAIAVAQTSLRKKNKDECSGTISTMGDPRQRGGVVIELGGCQSFDGRYFVESATHSFVRDAGYTTESSVRRALGY